MPVICVFVVVVVVQVVVDGIEGSCCGGAAAAGSTNDTVLVEVRLGLADGLVGVHGVVEVVFICTANADVTIAHCTALVTHLSHVFRVALY